MHLSEKGVMKCDPNAHSRKAANVDLDLRRPGHGNALRQATTSKHSYHVNFVATQLNLMCVAAFYR